MEEEKQNEMVDEITEYEKRENAEIADGNYDNVSSGNNSDALGLKATVIIAVIAIASVACAFVFVSKMNSSSKESLLDREKTGSKKITRDTTVVEVTGDKPDKTNKKPKKQSKGNNSENNDNESEEENGEEMEGNSIVPLESIVVNLGGVGSRRYLRVLINLEVESGEAEGKIKEKIVMLRDKMISLLSAKSAKEIETEGSLLRLRLEIKNILNEVLGTGETIKQVYFSDFIIQ